MLISIPSADITDSKVRNLSYSSIKPGVWLIHWLPPWPVHTGDCIAHYIVSNGVENIARVNTTKYIMNTTDGEGGPVNFVSVSAVIYSGGTQDVEGIPAGVCFGKNIPNVKLDCTLFRKEHYYFAIFIIITITQG